MGLLITNKNGNYSGRNVKIKWYGDYKIILEQVDRGWSEDAWKYEVEGTAITDECEGFDNAVMYAKKDIDKINV